MFCNGRGADGELRLGIRRAVQLKGPAAFPALASRPVNNGVTAAFDAISSRRVFNVCYNPRYFESCHLAELKIAKFSMLSNIY